MALISCVECGRQVSDQATACPNCGHPVSPRPATPPAIPQVHLSKNAGSKSRNTGCALIIAIVAILAIVASCLPSANRDRGTAPAETSRPNESPEQTQARLLADAKNERLPLEMRLTAAETLTAKFPDSVDGKAAAELAPTLAESIRKASIGRQWNYRTYDDPMTGKKVLAAFVTSTNTHDFKFPYAGAQHATLTARKHPQHGTDVIMSIERGQLLCRSYSACDVMVRFGEGQPRNYKAYGPDDNSSETLFIQGQADFIKRMQGVETVRIQAGVYQQGSPTWEFDVSGFDPDRMK